MGKLIVIYGINGVGKDSFASELNKIYKNSIVVSDQKILMYHLGLIDNFESKNSVDRAKYKVLENTPNDDFEKIYDKKFVVTLESLKNKYDYVFLISHLVVALFIDKDKPTYLDTEEINKKLKYILEGANGIILLKSSAEEILGRRLSDTGIRDRLVDVEEIFQHDKLNNEKWNEVCKFIGKDKIRVIINDDNMLVEAVVEGKNFIDNLN